MGCKISGIESLVSGLMSGIKVQASINGWFGVAIDTCRVRRRAVGGDRFWTGKASNYLFRSQKAQEAVWSSSMVPKYKKVITSFTVVSCRCCGNPDAERLGEWTEEEGEGDESPQK